MMIKEMLAPMPLKDPTVRKMFPEDQIPETMPGLMFFDTCEKAVSDMESIQSDDKNPNDCAKDPHDITHNVDAIRYFCITRAIAAENLVEKKAQEDFELENEAEDYDSYMCGGEVTAEYLSA
jgi:phage terminase large subunit